MKIRHCKAIAFFAAAALLGPGARCATASSENSAAETKQAETKKTEHSEKKAAEGGDEEKKPSTEANGVELGKFSVRMHRAVPTQTNRVSFTLFAALKSEDSKHLQQLLENRQNKVRDQVIMATRLVPVEEYDDAELTKFRRRILLRLRRTMPELMIEDVFVSDFNLVVENN
jgi:flagellar basal body-associated protein FliL